MRDLKHMLDTRRGRPSPPQKTLSRSLREPERRRRRLRLVLPLLILLLAAIPLVTLWSPLVAKGGRALSALRDLVSPTPPMAEGELFVRAAQAMAGASPDAPVCSARLATGQTVEYTVDPVLQRRVRRIFEENRVPYGVFVAIEPATGRILAMTSYSRLDPAWEERAPFTPFPLASLFKIVTAAAALEANKVTPETVVTFRGRDASENPLYWEASPGLWSRQMELTDAMAKSVNPVFGRLACDVVGRDAILSTAGHFGFNLPLFVDSGVLPSSTGDPQNSTELMLMGAGLGREVKASPLHVAAIMAAIANGGVMMRPQLVDRLRDPETGRVFDRRPLP
ncbi:MAG TPA: penicillin-binding transpeptidase domain-containing protein, partial [Geobacterales bacterium]|nr:penicillin-binding transpeptidase domain-containing protein [Geobacterales bacterium]